MKTELGLLSHQAYDSAFNKISAQLKINNAEDKDLIAAKEAREDIRLNGTVT